MSRPPEVWNFDTARIGRRVLVFDHLDSTNATAAGLANPDRERGGDPPDGLVVVADFQTAGRGQYGRVWQARPGSSLLLSVVLRPPPELCRPVVLTAFAAVAVGEAVLALAGVQARVKWPNDLLVHGKKVSGILIERHGPATVVGLGLNLNQTADEFADAGLPDATSLGIVSGKAIDSRAALGVVAQHLDREYGRLLGGERIAVEADWKWRVGLLGRQVAVELTDGTVIHGRLREMGFGGLELDTGEITPRVLMPETVRHITSVVV